MRENADYGIHFAPAPYTIITDQQPKHNENGELARIHTEIVLWIKS